MDRKWIVPAAVIVVLGGAAIATQTDIFSGPGDSVSEADLQAQREAEIKRVAAECEMWAYEQAGIPVDADDPERQKYSVVKSTAIGTAAGAGVGAVGGEATADKAGKGALVGAIVGGAAAYLKSRKDKKDYEADVQKQDAQLEAYEKAVNTCLTAKGY